MNLQQAEKDTLSTINRQIEHLVKTLKELDTAPFSDAVILLNLLSLIRFLGQVTELKMQNASQIDKVLENPDLFKKADNLTQDFRALNSDILEVHKRARALTDRCLGFAEDALGGAFFVIKEQEKKDKNETTIIEFE